MEQRFVFVLRIYLTESTDRAGHKVDALRGTLQAADSSEPSYFVSLRQLNELLCEELQPPDCPDLPESNPGCNRE